jgi:hypothetical protein
MVLDAWPMQKEIYSIGQLLFGQGWKNYYVKKKKRWKNKNSSKYKVLYKICNVGHEILTNLYKKLKKPMKLNSRQHNDRW